MRVPDQKATPVVELEDVFRSLNQFFDAGLPKEHRQDLRKWRNHVINDKQYSNRHGAARVFSNYEETIQLIEAAWVIVRLKDIIEPALLVTPCQIKCEKREWPYFPKNLSNKKLQNPLILIEKFFKKLSVSQYKEIFHEWLHLALSNKSAGETLSVKDVVMPYENLRKLYSVMWLVNQRQASIDLLSQC